MTLDMAETMTGAEIAAMVKPRIKPWTKPATTPKPPPSDTEQTAAPKRPKLVNADIIAPKPAAEQEPDVIPIQFTHDALATQFVDRHRDEWIFVADWDRWHRWDGARWASDDLNRAAHLARMLCREQADVALNHPDMSNSQRSKTAHSLASATTTSAVLRVSAYDPDIARTSEHFDADPWLLNTPLGVVNLQLGTVTEHRPDFHMTKMTGTSPTYADPHTPRADCPMWESFLAWTQGGDMETVAFLKRAVGYAATGLVRDHALFFLYGTGGNGKGTFIETISAVLGDYAGVIPVGVLMSKTMTQESRTANPEVAGLRGRRFVHASEGDEGER